jgi:hypothetical protein
VGLPSFRVRHVVIPRCARIGHPMNRVAFLAEVLPACLILQDRHQYVHGHMTILDRAALEGASSVTAPSGNVRPGAEERPQEC